MRKPQSSCDPAGASAARVGHAREAERCCTCSGLLLAHRVESLRCEGSDAIGAKRTCRERRERVDLTKMTQCMVRPCGARGFVNSGRCGLASMYPASDWSVELPAIMDISAR